MSWTTVLRAVPQRVRDLPPRWRRPVVAGVVLGYLGLAYGLLLAVQGVIGDDPVDMVAPLGPLAGSTAGGALGAWWVRRRLGGGARQWQYEAALRSRRLPEDADPLVWRPLLTRMRQTQRRAVLVVQGLVVSAAVLVLALAVERPVGRVVTGVVLVALVVALLGWWGRRQRRRLDELVARLPPS